MEKLFRVQVAKFFERASGGFPKFEFRTLDADAAAEYAQTPIAALVNSQSGTDYFFIVAPFGSSPGKVLVELGWKLKSEKVFPAVNVARALKARGLATGGTDWMCKSFASRLALLCNRGSSEMVWDMFSPEVWDEALESFGDYSRRTAFSSSDEALTVISSGEFNEQYAARQVELVCGDILMCMKRFGLPFLRRAAGHRCDELSFGS